MIVVIDLGNKQTTISSKSLNCPELGPQSEHINKLTLPTTILFASQPGSHFQIGLPSDTKYCIYDFVIGLGMKYVDEQWNRYAKFYQFDYSNPSANNTNGKKQLKGVNAHFGFNKNRIDHQGRIDVVIPGASQMNLKYRKISIEALVALYLRRFLDFFRSSFYSGKYNKLQQFIQGARFYVQISGVTNHSFRYALKQSCQMIGFQPIFLNSSYSYLCSHYFPSCATLSPSQSVQSLTINVSDKATTLTLSKFSKQQKILEIVLHSSLGCGGYHFTKTIAQYFVEKIKEQKGIDITRHGNYMGVLERECENVKKNVVGQDQDNEGWVRVASLPDQSDFGKLVNTKLLYQILQNPFNKIVKFIKQELEKYLEGNSLKYLEITQVILLGPSSTIPQLRKRLEKIILPFFHVEKINSKSVSSKISKSFLPVPIVHISLKDRIPGPFIIQKQQLTLFDISQYEYEVTGQQNFVRRLMKKGEAVPDRRNQKTKFPSGQLQFNLKILQNGNKIGHFLLDSRPSQLQFLLNFQINRNKLVWLYVKTDKGKIQLLPTFDTLGQQQMQKQMQIIKQFQKPQSPQTNLPNNIAY